VNTKPIIAVNNLAVTFDTLSVLKNTSLSFFPHDQVALIGANGAGKTTLLRVILGLLKPSSGTITTQANVSIGYLPQVLSLGDRLFPMTVKEVVQQGMIATKRFPRLMTRQDEHKVKETLANFQLMPFQDHPFGLLSLGQKQITLFARMMMQKPEIVFLDEPTSSLDVNRKDSLFQILNQLKAQQIPYVIITHDLPSFSDHIQRVIYLEHEVLFDGTYHDFCENQTFSPFIHTHGNHHDH
jgi:ABC-type Mn2+/Zn2+ transport system ATPase subunit